MTTPIQSCAKVAASPEQAKVWVSLLQAAGIPARVEGDALVDEFAASRRLMNLMGVQVMVPTSCVEQARELLQPHTFDADELTRQALEAGGGEMQAPTHVGHEIKGEPRRRWLWWLLLAGPGAPVLIWLLLQKLFA